MSEEIKEKLDLFPNNMNDIAKEAYYQLENYITNLQQKVEEKDKEIDRLNNIINELDEDIYSLYEDICNSDDTYSYRIPIEIIIDRLVKMTSKIAKFKENEELKDSDNNVKKINTNNN